MNPALQGLCQIPGVIGAAIFNESDECIDQIMPHPFEPMLLGRVMGEVRSALAVLDYLEGSSGWNALLMRFDAGYLVVKNVNQLTVLVLAQPNLNLSMLGVGFNVAALKIVKQAPAAPQPMAAGRSGAVPVQRMPTGQTGAFQAVSVPPPSSSSLSQSMSGLPGDGSLSGVGSLSSPRLASASTSAPQFSQFPGESQEPPMSTPNAVEKPVMDALLKTLAKHIGPMAKFAIKDELTKLGATVQTLAYTQWEDLVVSLSRRVPDPAKRREFVSEAERLPGKR